MSDAPIVELVDRVFTRAVLDQASDIHFEPFPDAFKIRYRVDGVLFELDPPPPELAAPLISRIKVLAGLDIAETRLPQDGRIQRDIEGRRVDFRVSTLPTQAGESVVLRVLDQSNVHLDLHDLGLPADTRERFLDDLAKPNGIIVITGPTGAGKTTTLYAALQHLNTEEAKILTAEDPVEYDIEGANQLGVRASIGLTFATALRSFLRQDPDIIMVGEIRDAETAEIAVQAALTGHLVLTTLHTNDAAGAITRWIDMGIEPYLIAATLEAVVAQRLVRKVCAACTKTRAATNQDWARLELAPPGPDRAFPVAVGCDACGGTGYRGRTGIFEHVQVNEALRVEILKRRPSGALRDKAREFGTCLLREDGARAIMAGLTTLEEVIRCT